MPSAFDAVEQAYSRIAADASPGIFVELVDRDVAFRAAKVVDAVDPPLPLAGTTLAVKGNIDVAGHRTTAGCPTFGSIAAVSAPVVRALEAAGTVTVAITNLDQFATGLVGTRSPYGICPNAHWPGLISGGSSSGSAVAVARALVDLALGTDTAGSGRVPAAANGIVGLKPTRGWLPTTGVVPACRSLDCVAIFARDFELGFSALQLAGQPRRCFQAPLHGSTGPIRESARRWCESWSARSMSTELSSPPALLYDGVRRRALRGGIVRRCPPRRRRSNRRGHHCRSRAAARGLARGPGGAGPVAPGHRDMGAHRCAGDTDGAARRRGRRDRRSDRGQRGAGTFTNFVNLLDLCALTFPLGPSDGSAPPASVTLVAPAWGDDALVSLARRVMRDTSASLRSE